MRLITFIFIFIGLTLLPNKFFPVFAQAAPTIGSITVQTPGNIEKYAKFEISFPITTAATNPYYPYDPAPPAGITPGIGINVDGFFLPPGQTNWANAKKTPCFYYQPVEQVGSGSDIAFMPIGSMNWRCRFAPDAIGTWQYRVSATDKNGTTTSAIQQFTAIASNRKGYIRVSATDYRFFEFSDATAFVAPLINTEGAGQPFNNLYDIRANIQKMGQNGISFVRWFANGEGTNNMVAPFSDDMRYNWGFGNAWTTVNDVDTARGKNFSFSPDAEGSVQKIIVKPGHYRLSFWAKVSSGTLRPQINTDWTGNNNLISASITSNTWNFYSYETDIASGTSIVFVGFKLSGSARTHSILFQRLEASPSTWGGNILTRSDPETYIYVDQQSSARLDEVLKVSEQYGVYHKITLFHKNDGVLTCFLPNGTVATNSNNCVYPNYFYAGDNQAARWYENAYSRYFLSRWSYSPALHSVEQANENDINSQSFDSGWKWAKFIKDNTPRPLLVSNSFHSYWVDAFFTDSTYGQYLDYSDKHWYANRAGGDTTVISNIWDDTTANIRQCYLAFKDYATWYGGYNKPFLRGETGVADSGTQPQYCPVIQDSTGTYYHKQIWNHVGLLGYTCGGEWYPWLFNELPDPQSCAYTFPSTNNSVYKMMSAYSKFIANEPLNNGTHVDLGVDLTGNSLITSSNSNLRVYGSKDPVTSRALVWIDNKNNTWQNPNYATVASGNFTISAMPPGSYTQETWDTRAGTFTTTVNAVTVSSNGNLQFSASTAKDLAFKFYIPGIVTPTTPITSPTPPPRCNPSGDIDCSGRVSVLDLSYLISKLGSSDYKADLDGNLRVNLLDFSLLLTNFGR